MGRLAWTSCLIAVLAWPAAADRPTEGRRADVPDDESSLLDGDLLETEPVPITLPAAVDQIVEQVAKPLIPEGTTVFDRPTTIEKGMDRKWWTIKDRRAGRLCLLPCRLLEAVEKTLARKPKTQFRVSGEVYHYADKYYLMLRQAVLVAPARKPEPAPPPPGPKGPSTKPKAPKPRPATPAKKEATADDVARTLLSGEPGMPVVPVARPEVRVDTTASVAPAGKPIQAGPHDVVMNRLTRLLPRGRTGWFAITFESDNTLREPPMRALPNEHLQQMESRSEGGTAAGALFHISGEVHRYKGADYLLLRNVVPKRNMGQF